MSNLPSFCPRTGGFGRNIKRARALGCRWVWRTDAVRRQRSSLQGGISSRSDVSRSSRCGNRLRKPDSNGVQRASCPVAVVCFHAFGDFGLHPGWSRERVKSTEAARSSGLLQLLPPRLFVAIGDHIIADYLSKSLGSDTAST